METNKILSADLLDLVFEDRNKDYGAYELRRTYDVRIKKALIITGTTVLLIISGTLLANKKDSAEQLAVVQREIELKNYVEDEPPPPPPPPPAAVEPPPVHTERLTDIVIRPDDLVENPPAPQEVFEKAEIGTAPIDAPDGPGILMPPGEVDGGTGILPPPKPHDPWAPVEVEATFDGDWRKFMENTLHGDVPVSNGAAAGKYTVILQFMIDAEGQISDIRPLTNLGFGMEQEAVRALKKAKKWRPAIQNGRAVPTYRKQPVTFIVNEE